MKVTKLSPRRVRLGSSRRPRMSPPATVLDQLKRTVRRRLVETFEREMPEALIRRALDEAEELARASGFPQLFLPELAAEQVRRVSAALHGDEERVIRRALVTEVAAAVAA